MDNYTKPSFLRRAAAYTVDYIISGILALPLAIIFSVLDAYVAKPQQDENLSMLFLALMMISLLVIIIGYFLLRDGLPKGSLGKRWLGLMVIDQKNNRACNYGKSIIRNLIFMVIGGIDGLIPLFTKDGKKASDMVAGTLVIKKKEFGGK